MRQFILFCLVGIINTAFGVGIYCFFIWIGACYQAASLLSTIIGILWNFKTTGAIVFRNKDNRRIFPFFLCYGIMYLANITVIKFFKVMGCNDYCAGALAAIWVAVATYLIQKKFVFATSGEDS